MIPPTDRLISKINAAFEIFSNAACLVIPPSAGFSLHR